MLPTGLLTPGLRELLVALDEVDARLRTLYGELADDPDLAEARDGELQELRAKRLDLARGIGIEMLARFREGEEAPREAAAVAEEPAPAEGLPEDSPAPKAKVLDEAPPSAPVSEADLAAWKERMSNGFGVASPPPRAQYVPWEAVLERLLGDLGPPRDLGLELHEEVEALDAVGQSKAIGRWAQLPPEVARMWLSLLVARTRAVKDTRPSADVRERIKSIIYRYPPWAKEHRPGYVNGMKLEHVPTTGSWAEDARELWAKLKDLITVDEQPPRDTPKASAKKKPPRANGENVEHPPAIGADWALWPAVRARSGVVVGGDPREASRKRLEESFQLASLEWPDLEGPRKVAALAERIRRGSVDLVIVLQPFVSHKQADLLIDAAKDAGTAWVTAQGYGVAAVKLAFERFLASAH